MVITTKIVLTIWHLFLLWQGMRTIVHYLYFRPIKYPLSVLTISWNGWIALYQISSLLYKLQESWELQLFNTCFINIQKILKSNSKFSSLFLIRLYLTIKRRYTLVMSKIDLYKFWYKKLTKKVFAWCRGLCSGLDWQSLFWCYL